MDLFNDFDDLFSSLFNKFNRPVMDQKYYSVFKKEGKGYIIVFNTLGMSKDDISVNIETHKGRAFKTLHIKGEKNIEDINFHNSVDMAVQLNFTEQIESVQYSVKDGLTKVFLKVKLPELPKISAECIDDENKSLDW